MVEDPAETYPTINVVWAKFVSLFGKLGGIVFCTEVFEEFYIRSLREFYEDNVQYLEIRGMLFPVYDLDGKFYEREETMRLMFEANAKFVSENPDFTGSKFIVTGLRSLDTSAIEADIDLSMQLMKKFPDFFVGYDLVGPEESGHTLQYFSTQLLKPKEAGVHLNYLFHGGETAWSGTEVDQNLIDAIALNTSRIGHGYAITKHPTVKQMAREKDIAVEVNPLSNQILKLVSDLRNHPASELLAEGFPVVISSDDPGLWGAKGLSYDWYAAFMGLGGEWADLRMLKQLAMDSIKYSSLSDVEKGAALSLWQKKWDTFIRKIINLYDLSSDSVKFEL